MSAAQIDRLRRIAGSARAAALLDAICEFDDAVLAIEPRLLVEDADKIARARERLVARINGLSSIYNQ